MNHLLHNISIIILGIGIILMTVYITRTTTSNYQTREQIMNQQNEGLRKRQPIQNIYDYRVSKEYEKMFSQPSIWQGYQDFDANDTPPKTIY
jgi:capsular polysaccharide biosynthesis protein